MNIHNKNSLLLAFLGGVLFIISGASGALEVIDVLEEALAAAGGFSPSKLVYVLGPNEELCQFVHLTSDSENITIFDVWAENETVEWKVSFFNTTAEEHGLTLTYPEELSIDERDISVCVSGEELGEYRGAVIFREGQEGMTVVQYAVWMTVIIEEAPPQQEQP